jgi:hypothetical protein
MTRISWKENRVLSIETRKGVYVVGQMLKQPYIRFYNMFTTESSPNNVNTIKLTVLFTAAITRQFLRYSQVYVLKDATPDIREIDSDIWINQFSGSRKVIAYQGSGEEIGCMILGNKPGGLLVKKNLWWTPTTEQPIRLHPSGVFDEIICSDIPLTANDIIDKYELTGLCVFPYTNERLYLCSLYNKSVDPYKDLIFNRNLPDNYRLAVEIISGGFNDKKRNEILSTYFTDSQI